MAAGDVVGLVISKGKVVEEIKRPMNLGEEADHSALQPTAEDIFDAKVEMFRTKVQEHLDNLAVSWGYDNIISLKSYHDDDDPQYAAEGTAGRAWRSAVWKYCDIELGKVKLGERPEPESAEAFILELPEIVRPQIN